MTQTLRKIGIYPACSGGIPTGQDCYAAGYITGRAWKNNWAPGGPWHCSVTADDTHRNDSDWIAFCEATQENHTEWMIGWWDGLNEMDPTNTLLRKTDREYWISRRVSLLAKRSKAERVYGALSRQGRARTSMENVRDVLAALESISKHGLS